MKTLIVDEKAPGSLELVRRLNGIATVENLGDGVYQVDGNPRAIQDVLDAYPQAVMKLETA